MLATRDGLYALCFVLQFQAGSTPGPRTCFQHITDAQRVSLRQDAQARTQLAIKAGRVLPRKGTEIDFVALLSAASGGNVFCQLAAAHCYEVGLGTNSGVELCRRFGTDESRRQHLIDQGNRGCGRLEVAAAWDSTATASR